MENLLEKLNKDQKEAVVHENGPLLIVAGAGTGKTTVITQRIAWLILEKKIKPDEILALTFTEKAAGEMEERVDQLLPYGYVDLWISTFHAFCERVLQDHAIEIGLPGDFKLLNQTAQWLLVRQNLERFDLDYYRPLGNPTKFIHTLLKHFSRAKDEEIWPEDYINYVENLELNKDSVFAEERDRLKEVAKAYGVYQQLLLENNFLDFGDLINYTLKLFRTRLQVLEEYRKKFKYILVDEFQDTNWAQYALIKMLSAPNNNLTVVGDDNQSVYKFRGASVSNILQFKNDFPEAKQAIIIDNYRSKQNILDLAYRFIKQNDPNTLEAKLNISKKLEAKREGEGIIEHFHVESAELEAKTVADKILELKKDDETLKWNDFAVLVRANSQAELFMQAFDRGGIPYQFLASAGLYSKPIILDVIAYLKILDDYHESSAVYRILNMPLVQLDYEDIVKLNYFSRRKNWSLYETLKNAPVAGVSQESLRKINKILGFIEKHAGIAREKGVGKAVYSFLEDFNILKDLSHKAEVGDLRAVENIGYINQFLKKIEDFERTNPDKSAKKFLAELNMAVESGEEGALSPGFEEGPETVKILTVHGAKGLEFKYVFIVNLVDLRFPSTNRKDPIELPGELVKETIPEGDIHLEEERRLFYVALTRGRDGVFLTSASDYGGQRKKKISRFLVELGFVEPKTALMPKEEYFKGGEIHNDTREFKISLPSKFSFTQLKAFETCPLQYKFAHILAIPVRGKFVFSFGKTMHSALQKFFEQMLKVDAHCQKNLFGNDTTDTSACLSLDDLLKIYEETWINDWYDNKAHEEEYKKQGRQSLREFYKINKDNWPKVKYLELGFNLKIGDYTVRGAIDRIDKNVDGSVELVDYKTGSFPQDEKCLDRDQLLIYQLAASEIFNENVTKLSYYYLSENKTISFLGTLEDLSKTKEKIIATIEEIKQSGFLPKPSLFTCKNCDFKDICEHRVL
ncbi:MAG TPA: UvrD-helicase domain-containing protein [Patescibacteria group bacterium]|nr:UvrD-helicase domain-containing protein [Patescibacteria group bacterium]